MNNQRRTGTLKIYKSTGAAQFSLLPARYNDSGFMTKEGAVLVEVCQCFGKGPDGNIKTDWPNKLTFAISVADIANLMDHANPKAARLYHKHSGMSKTLEFKAATDQRFAGTYMLEVRTTDDQKNSKRVSVPLTCGQYELIMRLIIGVAAPKMLGWD